MKMVPQLLSATLLAATVLIAHATVAAADEAKSVTVALADGKLEMTSPATWIPVEPKFRGIVDYEFTAPKAEGDDADGRVTIGGLSGGLEANKQRWFMQFSQPDGGNAADAAKSETKKLADSEVEILDVSGTYVAPPFAGGGRYENYRMLAAVINAGKLGSYYVKFYGPARTIHANQKAFESMVNSLKLK